MKDAIRYVVTVEAVIERVEKAGKEWRKTSDNPDSKYAYTPEIEITAQKKIEIYKQEIDFLDMKELVKTVNGIPRIVTIEPNGVPDLGNKK